MFRFIGIIFSVCVYMITGINFQFATSPQNTDQNYNTLSGFKLTNQNSTVPM